MASVSNTQRMQESYDAERAQTRAQHERDLDKTKEDTSRELASAKKEYNERLQQNRQEAASDIRKLKEDLYDSKGRKIATDGKDLQQSKNELNRYRDESAQEAERKVNRAEDAAKSRVMQMEGSEDERVQKALEAQKRSNLAEVTALREEMNHYRDEGHEIDSEKAKAKAATVRETEGGYIKERNRVVDSYENTIGKMRSEDNEKGELYSRKLSEATVNANEMAKKQIMVQQKEFAQNETDARAMTHHMDEFYQRQLKNAAANQERSSNTLIAQNEVNRDRALSDQDKTYQNYLKENRDHVNFESNQQVEKIHELQTTNDPLKVSPAVVQRIEDASDQRNYALLKRTEQEQNENLQAARTRDLTERRELKTNFDSKSTATQRERQRAQDLQSKQYLTAYTELSQRHQNETAAMKQKMSEALERQNLKNSESGQVQAARFKDELDLQKDALLVSKGELQDDLDFKQRTQGREWSMKLNDMRREFDTRMADERDAHEKMMTQSKYEFDKRLRDQERTSTRAMDDRVKQYEHQIKQQELAFKQREQFLTEHYEEELDKMKRSNARLIQTKS